MQLSVPYGIEPKEELSGARSAEELSSLGRRSLGRRCDDTASADDGGAVGRHRGKHHSPATSTSGILNAFESGCAAVEGRGREVCNIADDLMLGLRQLPLVKS